MNPEKKRTSKRLQPEVQKSIEEVLNHSRNTKGKNGNSTLNMDAFSVFGFEFHWSIDSRARCSITIRVMV